MTQPGADWLLCSCDEGRTGSMHSSYASGLAGVRGVVMPAAAVSCLHAHGGPPC